eukprot:m.102754 g.102754  ORF g.102754 m.102754 type:complete len:392 (+) comp15195_c0_seq1:56-1231(+)
MMMARLTRRLFRKELRFLATPQTALHHRHHSSDSERELWLKGLNAILKEQDGDADNSTLQSDMLHAGVPLTADSPPNAKRLTAAVIGVPNVGKSTLINRILDHNLFIVSPREHTTRQRACGVWTSDTTQTVFIDTPGIVSHRDGRRLNVPRSVLVDGKNALLEADVALTLIDDFHVRGRNNWKHHVAPLSLLPKQDELLRSMPNILVINKIDKLKEDAVFQCVAYCADLTWPDSAEPRFQAIHTISAATGHGVDALKEELLSLAKPGEWDYSATQLTDQSRSQLVFDSVREQLFAHLRQELPYTLKQELQLWHEDPVGNRVEIGVTLFARSRSQLRIVLGGGGKVVKAICRDAEAGLTLRLQRPVKLRLTVQTDNFEQRASESIHPDLNMQ